MNQDFHEFERAGWDQSAAVYDFYFSPLTNETAAKITSSIRQLRAPRVLEIACGPGHLCWELHRRGVNVIGIDFSESMINLAKRVHPDVIFQIGDAHNLAFQDDSFGAVVMNFGMLHLAWPDKAISEAFRVLWSGGRFIFTVWNEPERSAGFKIILDAISANGNKDILLPEGPPFFQFADDTKASSILKNAGFGDVSFEDYETKWVLPDPDAIFRAFFEGTARTGGFLRSQKKEALDKIRASCTKAMESFVVGESPAVPMSIKIITAMKN